MCKTREEFFDSFVQSFTDYATDLVLKEIRTELELDKHYMDDERSTIKRTLLRKPQHGDSTDILRKGLTHYAGMHIAMGLSVYKNEYVDYAPAGALTDAMPTILYMAERNVHLVDAIINKCPKEFKKFIKSEDISLLPDFLEDDMKYIYLQRLKQTYKELNVIYVVLGLKERELFHTT